MNPIFDIANVKSSLKHYADEKLRESRKLTKDEILTNTNHENSGKGFQRPEDREELEKMLDLLEDEMRSRNLPLDD